MEMEYTRKKAESSLSVSPNVTFLWGNDGWRYCPELGFRDKFTTTHYYRMSWDGVIAIPEHIEALPYKELTASEWQEGDDVFQPKTPIQKTTQNKNAQRVPHQRRQRA